MSITAKRRAGAVLCAAAAAVFVLPAAGAAAETEEVLDTSHTNSLVCDVSYGPYGQEFGYYGGVTVSPATGQVTAAGTEAQCALQSWSAHESISSPGTIDGIFGTNSQGSMKDFQAYMNDAYDAGLAVDGIPGPESWPYLRCVTDSSCRHAGS